MHVREIFSVEFFMTKYVSAIHLLHHINLDEPALLPPCVAILVPLERISPSSHPIRVWADTSLGSGGEDVRNRGLKTTRQFERQPELTDCLQFIMLEWLGFG